MNINRYGTGPRHFLCLHGWSGNHSTFAPLASPGATLWCPDLPATSARAITDDLAAIARRIPGPLEIVGNCSGAVYGLLLAQRIGARRIVMIDAFAFWPAYFRVFLAPVWGRWAYWTAFANPVGRWLANRSLASHRTGNTDLTDGFSRVDHTATYRHLEILSAIGPSSQFSGLDAEIDIVFGERTFEAAKRSAMIWSGIFPQARRHRLPGAGHLPILEATEALKRILLEAPECPAG